MKILHILSQREVTGAETYAVALAEYQLKQGHQVFIISDTLNTPTNAIYIAQPIDKRSYSQRIKNIRFIRSFVKQHQIDVVNTHSRAGSWVAYFALKGTTIPLVSAVHGRQHLHTSTSLYDIYGDKVIAICEHMKTHLVQEVKIQPHKIVVIRNGFDVSRFNAPNVDSPSEPVISIIGRTSGFKGEKTGVIVKDVMPKLLKEFPSLKLNIIGGKAEQLGEETLTKITELNHEFGDRIKLIGHVNNVLEWMKHSSIVIGSGRVAMEACLIEVPCLALGESSYHGLVLPGNKEEIMAANFGDIQPLVTMPAIDFSKMYVDLKQFLSERGAFQSNRNWLADNFSINKVGDAILDTYRSAIMKKNHPRWIPILMYHKVPVDTINSKHQIYVTRASFELQLKGLKAAGYTGITFKEYEAYRSGNLSMKQFPKKPIILTFDDGYEDNHSNAFPLLKKYGFRAVIYAMGDTTLSYNAWDVPNGEPRQALMNKDMMLEMQAWGIEFGAHTLTHTDLTSISVQEAQVQIAQSKHNLEQVLGQPVISFANPYGRTNEAIKILISQAGYKYAVATDSGPVHLEDDVFQIFRVAIFPNDIGSRFKKKTATWYRRYIRFKYGR